MVILSAPGLGSKPLDFAPDHVRALQELRPGAGILDGPESLRAAHGRKLLSLDTLPCLLFGKAFRLGEPRDAHLHGSEDKDDAVQLRLEPPYPEESRVQHEDAFSPRGFQRLADSALQNGLHHVVEATQ